MSAGRLRREPLASVMSERWCAATRTAAGAVEVEREHLVLAVSGAHAYGFPSDDSDVDLKGVHLAPTRELLGLGRPRPSHQRAWIEGGIEIDYGSNEAAQALSGALKGDGNVLERILGPIPVIECDEVDSLRDVVRRNLSRRVARHYSGFARAQLQALEDSAEPRLKSALYVLRTATTGAHLLETGRVEPNLVRLAAERDLDGVDGLVAAKRTAERGVIPAALRPSVERLVRQVFEALDRALERSCLPEEPAAPDELSEWLVGARCRRLHRGGGRPGDDQG